MTRKHSKMEGNSNLNFFLSVFINCLFFLGEALSRAELCKAELELEINKIKTEDASLRDALLKMQALNEGLGQDKIELNKIIMQVCSPAQSF